MIGVGVPVKYKNWSSSPTFTCAGFRLTYPAGYVGGPIQKDIGGEQQFAHTDAAAKLIVLGI